MNIEKKDYKIKTDMSKNKVVIVISGFLMKKV